MKVVFCFIFTFVSILVHASPPDTIWFKYEVDKGETLEMVAEKFHVDPMQIVYWNKLRSKSLKANQSLTIGAVMRSGQALVTDDKLRNDSIQHIANQRKFDSTQILNRYKGKEILEGGLGAYFEGTNLDHEKYYALHNKAPIGTIIKVENVRSKKNIYVQVVGTINQSYDTNNIIIVSKIASEKLAIEGDNFICKLSYTKD